MLKWLDGQATDCGLNLFGAQQDDEDSMPSDSFVDINSIMCVVCVCVVLTVWWLLFTAGGGALRTIGLQAPYPMENTAMAHAL